MAVLLKKGTEVWLYEPITNKAAKIPTPDAMREIMDRLGLDAPRAVDEIPGTVVGMQALLADIPGFSQAVPVDPGLQAQQWEAMLTLQKYIADLQAEMEALGIAEQGRIADIQAEIDQATLAQNQLQFEASMAFELEKFGLSQEEFEERKEQFRQQFGLSKEQFDFTKESFLLDFGLRREQFEADFGLRERQFEAQQDQFAQQFGLSREQFEQAKFEFGSQFGLEQEKFGLERTLAEANLAANPSNFVALQLYKRSLEEQGITAPEGQGALGDEDIQDLFSLVLGLEEGSTQGTGQFGVGIPTPGAISRSQAGQFTESDIGLLESFLKGGVDVGQGEFAGINPADFFQEVEEGFIPTIDPGLAEVRF